MISIPAFVILLPFAAIGLLIAFLGLMNISNLLRFGARNWMGFLATFIFISGAAFIVFFAWQAMPQTDWTAPINLSALTAQTF